MASDFQRDVHDVLVDLRPGQVVSYGWVAEEAGRPGAARAVGAYLKSQLDPPNWWRVVGAKGCLISPSADEQAERLRAEGHEIVDSKLRGLPQLPGG